MPLAYHEAYAEQETKRCGSRLESSETWDSTQARAILTNEELLSLIALHLPVRDIGRLARVHPEVAAAVRSADHLWHQLGVRDGLWDEGIHAERDNWREVYKK